MLHGQIAWHFSSLEAGKLADFVILDRDYMTCPERDIKDILPLATIVGGEVVYIKNNEEVTVMWKGMPLKFDVKPILENGVTYVSAKVLFDNMGIEYIYDSNSGKITAKNELTTKEVSIKQVNNQLYVPLREVPEYFGYQVDWYPESMSISLGL
ncbi:hypothetical protein J2Z76_001249 [Sedimentibacter acidaminivorans]|uniref:Copper amine oxidase-like N-terminal domain-containing protein n=1 Tax=Sedimentibacter acidaminivorans TaxID=913099 RepID=A0ABS4GCH3_9FIRM|nr:stalk domain-containing protein [Sedimentibacter acidaminivorans]MBP1925390.1 hypothetical protein [Sedimentibacter acidaminivorans]